MDKRILVRLIISLIFILNISSGKAQKLVDFVNVFWGTSGDHGQMDPSATLPFGMIKPGPDSKPGNHGGYNYLSQQLKGFSHNRFSGVGCQGTGGNLQILPFLGKVPASMASMDKTTEKAEPGYYAVKLNSAISAELTASNQTAYHRYLFPENATAGFRIDAGSSFTPVYQSELRVLNQQEMMAVVSAKNVCDFGRYTQYYHIWCSRPLKAMDTSLQKRIFLFETKGNTLVEIRVTVSAISLEDARNTWQKTARATTFNQQRSKASQAWETMLSRVTLEGETERKQLFYSHLYQCLLNPVKIENAQKQFRATDGSVQTAKDFTMYAGWSMWDNYRNKFPLFTLLYPELCRDIAKSLEQLYTYGKSNWSGYYEPVPTVRTEHSLITLLDFYQKGIRNFNLEKVYGTEMATLSDRNPQSDDGKLEMYYDYWALGQMAGLLGKKADSILLMDKANGYQKLWTDKFRNIDATFDIMHHDGLYEGTRWQYRWFVPFDMAGLQKLAGGADSLVNQLSFFFDYNLYNHGNQPDIHAPFLFNVLGRPWLTQKWVYKILTQPMVQQYGTHDKWKVPFTGRIYRPDPEAFIPEMDNDDGTMSAWFVLASMGLYPDCVGRPVYQICTPIFDKVTLHLQGGKRLEILSENSGEDYFYIKNASLNGKSYEKSFLYHTDLIKGGTLKFALSNKIP
jgi:putative alpha-1,2-mannosidase